MTGVLSSDSEFYELNIVPQVTYVFEVIARMENEDTNQVKWFKSKMVEFATSHAKSVKILAITFLQLKKLFFREIFISFFHGFSLYSRALTQLSKF